MTNLTKKIKNDLHHAYRYEILAGCYSFIFVIHKVSFFLSFVRFFFFIYFLRPFRLVFLLRPLLSLNYLFKNIILLLFLHIMWQSCNLLLAHVQLLPLPSSSQIMCCNNFFSLPTKLISSRSSHIASSSNKFDQCAKPIVAILLLFFINILSKIATGVTLAFPYSSTTGNLEYSTELSPTFLVNNG